MLYACMLLLHLQDPYTDTDGGLEDNTDGGLKDAIGDDMLVEMLESEVLKQTKANNEGK